MCTNKRHIYNRYIRRTVTVDCGKCPSCLQAKAAHRANRIRNTVSDGYITLFITLTYDNMYVPYFKLSDVSNRVSPLSVYRDYDGRYVRASSDYKQSFVPKCLGGVPIDEVEIDYAEYLPFELSFKSLNKKTGCVGVCYYKDIQDWRKRFVQYCKTYIDNEFTYKAFFCSEYGGTTLRPHFHALLFIRSSYEQAVRRAVVACWPFADSRRTSEYIQVARDAASYVSSYVNSGSNVSKLLKINPFRSKHSYSKGFGLGVSSFSLDKILQKVDSGDCRYNSVRIRDGAPVVCSFPLPDYVINRYWPRFKGLSRLAPSEVAIVVLYPARYSDYRDALDLTDDDIHRFKVRINHAYDYYHTVTGKNRFDFAHDYNRVWIAHWSAVFEDSFLEVESLLDFKDYYFNAAEYVFGRVRSLSLDALGYDKLDYQLNPNFCVGVQEKSANLEFYYYKYCKQKNVTNMVMASAGHDV